MGFWGSLWNGVKTVGKYAAGAAAGLAAFAAAPPTAIVAGVAAAGAYAVKKLSEDVGSAAALTATSTIQQVEDITEKVRVYRDKYSKEGEALEDYYQKELDKYFENLIEMLKQDERVAERIDKSFGIQNIQKQQQEMSKKIKGTITNAIALNLSIDNYECRQILGLDAGPEKTKQMENFANRVIAESREGLANKVGRILYNQTDEIMECLQEQLDKKERDTDKATKEFEHWAQDMENNTFNQEQAQLQPAVKLYAIEQLEKIVKAA